jgi:hypothetical protein
VGDLRWAGQLRYSIFILYSEEAKLTRTYAQTHSAPSGKCPTSLMANLRTMMGRIMVLPWARLDAPQALDVRTFAPPFHSLGFMLYWFILLSICILCIMVRCLISVSVHSHSRTGDLITGRDCTINTCRIHCLFFPPTTTEYLRPHARIRSLGSESFYV